MKARHIAAICIVLAAVAIVAVAWPAHGPASSPQECGLSDADLPALAVVLPASADAPAGEMLHYRGFDVNFNPRHHVPNYVSWILVPQHTDGPYSRKGVPFAADDTVSGCPSLADYRRSGYDRGHMAPAADMRWDSLAMLQCHLLTNMCPQDKKLNSVAWSTVEKNCRAWTRKYGPLVIVAGPVLTDSITRHIGSTQVSVPERFFKAVLAPMASPPMAIAFIMPNNHVEGGAQTTVVTVDEAEAITGYDFFSALPDEIETEVESHANYHIWNY